MSQYNPYAAPQAAPQLAPAAYPAGGGNGPQPWEIGEVLGHAWNVFKPNWATLVFSQLLAGFLGGMPTYIPGILVVTQAVEQNSTEYWVIYGICFAASMIVNTFFQVGLTKICLAAARQQSPQFGDLFSGGSRYFALLGSTFLVFLAGFLGYLVFIVPGVILFLGLSLSSYYVVDQNMGPIQGMRASWEATKGQKGQLFLFSLVAVLLFIGGCVACYIGMLVALPLVMVSFATIYLRLSGQWGSGGMAYGPPGGYPPPGGYGPPPGGGFGPPPGGGYGPPPGGGGGYGPPPGGGGGYGPPAGGGGGYGPPGGGGGYGPPPGY